MRLFVAVYPPQEVREHLAARVRTLALSAPPLPGRSLRLVGADQWHVTVAFLGEIPDRRVPAVEQALGVATSQVEPCVLQIAGGGRFGRGRFTVVWAGVRGDLAGLSTLVAEVRGQLRRAHCPFDGKVHQPHLTLARPGDRMPHDVLDGDIRALDEYEGPAWPVTEVRLMRSHLGPRPTYDVVDRWTVGDRTS